MRRAMRAEVANYVALAIVCYVVLNHPMFALGCHVRAAPLPMRRGRSHLIVCTHGYEHIDLFAVLPELSRWHARTGLDTTIVVADRLHNKLYDRLFPKPGRCLYVTRGTTAKMLDRLRDTNVCVFLYEDSTATGIHHVLRAFRGPVTLLRIRSSARRVREHSVVDCIRRCNGLRYTLSYDMYDAAAHASLTPPDGMARLKRALYASVDASSGSRYLISK